MRCVPKRLLVTSRLLSVLPPPILSPEDEKLVHRNDFHGVQSTRVAPSSRMPEVSLARIHQHNNANGRVSGLNLFVDVLLRLERGDEDMVSLLRSTSSQWIPMLISVCGYPLSNVHRNNRQQILERMWKQFKEREIPITLSAFNELLKVLMENESTWNAWKALEECEQEWKLEPDQTTFRLLLQKLALLGDVEGCRKMMARRGFALDAPSYASLVYSFAVRGHTAKADSMLEQSIVKYGPQGEKMVLSACAKAAASRFDTERLRTVLRRSVDESKILRIDSQTVFDTIWRLAQGEDGGRQSISLIDQMLRHTSHKRGFFKLLFREIERHICHDKLYVAIALMEDMRKVSDCLDNQNRYLYMNQLVTKLCRHLVMSASPIPRILDVANRLLAMFKGSGPKVYDELVFAALMKKNLSVDERIEYLSSMVDYVDRSRERPHLLLPLIVFADDTEDRLKVLFRASVIGYSKMEQLDPIIVAVHLLQPLYDRQRVQRNRGKTPLERCVEILRSYGVDQKSVWWMLHAWRQVKMNEERSSPVESHRLPRSIDIQQWLATNHARIFNEQQTMKSIKNIPNPDRFLSYITQRNASKMSMYLREHGWPATLNGQHPSTAVDIFLEQETWENVHQLLAHLSAVEGSSPLSNDRILRILARYVRDGHSMNDVIECAYELKKLFPQADYSYDTFHLTMSAYNRLFTLCLDVQKDFMKRVDECVELLQVLVKLELLSLHPNETLTCTIIRQVLRRVDWKEAVNTWMKLQSSLSCGNGLVVLLNFALAQNAALNVQYVLHKAQNFMSRSRVYSLYAAVLASRKEMEEAERVIEQHKNEISPMDCVLAFRFVNALWYRVVGELFLLTFPSLCLRHIPGMTHDASALLGDALRICESRNLGPLANKFHDMLTEHGVTVQEEDLRRMHEMMERHEQLASRWIFAPSGFLNIKEDDEILKGVEWYPENSERTAMTGAR